MKLQAAVSLILIWMLAAPLPGAELPIRTVVLYKHGVGYFERAGQMGPGESAELQFRAEDMNDVLKSLTVTDQGGKITGLRYDSSVPLEEKLQEFPFRIENGQPLTSVIDQLKGARLEMEFGPQKTAGAIVSARLIAGDKDKPEREQLTLLMDTGELRNVDLAAATAIRFTDAKLQLQFRDYLAALTGARSKDRRSLYIDSTDSKARDVRAEYILPMPAWKSSYRLLLDEAGTQGTLEGWAIVDNTTGEDWTKVKMSLVSGKPISFISQLYEPKFITRLSASLAEDQAIAPKVFGGALDAAKDSPRRPQQFAALQPAPQGATNGVVAGSGGGVGGGVYRVGGNAGAQSSSVAASGPAQEIADLFEYSIASPVTVKKNESVMLPFLQQKIASRKLVIYSDQSRPNPFSAAELTNDTGKTLDGGPITVYDANTYAGEALVETFKNADKRFISYGVDLGTRISTNLNSRTDYTRELHAHAGILTTRSAVVQTKTYTALNVDARAKTLIIEHPIRGGFSLINTPKPSETARDVYRFEVKLAANGKAEFPVTEENVYDQQTQVSSLNSGGLLVYVRNKVLSDAGRRQLQQIADVKAKIEANDTDKKSVTDQIANVTRDEERNRQNIASLSSVSGQQQIVQDYARKLADQETQIAGLRDQGAALDKQKAALQDQVNDLIGKLDF
jgi:hypothetical protein